MNTKLETTRDYFVQEIGIKMVIPDKWIKTEVRYDATLRATELTIIIEGLSKPAVRVAYPSDWWQAFKEQWFPRWLLHLFPVEKEVWEAARFCPHAAVTDIAPHLDFLDTPDVTHLSRVTNGNS